MLPILHLRLNFQATRGGMLPGYPGALWRSAMGMHLRAALCYTGLPRCAECPARRQCSYAYLMETPPPQDASLLAHYRDAPHPYVLLPHHGGPTEPEQPASLDLKLFGGAIQHRAAVQRALVDAAREGLGPRESRVNFTLVGTEDLAIAPEPPPPPPGVRIHLNTPLSLRVQEQYLRPQHLNFRHFFSTTLRRVTQMTEVHAGQPLTADFRALCNDAEKIPLSNLQLNWESAARYSARQRREVNISGMRGSFDVSGDLAPFWPWLWMGQWLHIGKHTVIGLGAYQLEALHS